MGLWGYLSELVTGVDLDAEQARAKALDAQIAEQNRSAYERGIWTDEQFEQAEANRAQNAAEVEQYYPEVGKAFVEGAKEGLQAEAVYVNRTLNSVGGGLVSWVWEAIPLWVWALLALWAAWKLGAFKR